MKPLVSLVVPVYNVEKYLTRCIHSLLDQAYTNIEVNLIDDGSTDNSGALCDYYKENDKRIRVIHQKNKGLGETRNTGIEQLSGKYVLFIDSDDYIDADAILTLVELAEKYQADVVTTRFIYDDHEETSMIKTGIYSGSYEIKNLLVHMLGSRRQFEDQLNVSAATKLYSVELIKRAGIRFPSEKKLIWEDLAFNIELFPFCERVYVSDYAYYHYCYNENSLTHKYIPDKFSRVITMYDFIYEKLFELEMPDEAYTRTNNTFMGNVRTCMKLEAYYAKQNGYRCAVNAIRTMCDDARLQRLVKSAEREDMNMQQRIFKVFIERKMPLMLLLLAYIQNKRKGDLIN